ncbi:hypothetical protein [Streptomyces sp. NBC_00459]|uniref:hypothetical protein n=1 Tax=Streptomyces sp. NBC_00459 TaxID=2975749 RepID=UPI002E17EA20
MVTAPRYTPPATAEPPKSSRRVRTRPLALHARTAREPANPQQPADGPNATIRAAPFPAAHGAPNVSTVPTTQATPTAPQTHVPVRWQQPARTLSTSGDFPNPDIRCALPPVPARRASPTTPGSVQKP